MVGHRNISLRFLPWSSQIGSCVLKADSRPIYRPILSQYVGRHLSATQPTLRSFGQLFLLSSIFCIQLLIIFSSPLGGAFRRPSSFFGLSFRQHHLCRFSSSVFSTSSLLYTNFVTITLIYYYKIIYLAHCSRCNIKSLQSGFKYHLCRARATSMTLVV